MTGTMGTQSDAELLASLADMAFKRRPEDPVLAQFLPRYYRELPADDAEAHLQALVRSRAS